RPSGLPAPSQPPAGFHKPPRPPLLQGRKFRPPGPGPQPFPFPAPSGPAGPQPVRSVPFFHLFYATRNPSFLYRSWSIFYSLTILPPRLLPSGRAGLERSSSRPSVKSLVTVSARYSTTGITRP